MYEDYNEVVRLVGEFTGFSTKKIHIDEREYEGGRCVECWFTVAGRSYWTDFVDFDFA